MKKVDQTDFLLQRLQHKQIYVLSPHYDDAVLSTGSLLFKLKEIADISIINIFTQAHSGPYTLSGKSYLRKSGNSNAVDLYKVREQEDMAALYRLGVHAIDLRMTDALFRKRTQKPFLGKILPEFEHLYPTYRFHVVKVIHPGDFALSELIKQLEKRIPAKAIILSPAGIGNHADHRITRQAAESVGTDIIYYADFPYTIRQNTKFDLPEKFRSIAIKTDFEIRAELIRCYASQITGLFAGEEIPNHQEVFFVKR